MSDELELKPCPFCGAAPVGPTNHWASIEHGTNCWRTLMSEFRIEQFHERVFAAWNVRADLVGEREAALKRGLEQCLGAMEQAAGLLEMFPDDYGDAINNARELLKSPPAEVLALDRSTMPRA